MSRQQATGQQLDINVKNTTADARMPLQSRISEAEEWFGPTGSCTARAPGKWWVLHTRARNEKQIASRLTEQCVRYYLPLVQVRHTYAKAKISFDVPLFPGYVFMFGDHDDCDKARKTNRIAGILHVSDQGQLCAELRHIRRVIESGRTVELFPALEVGRRCRIVRGVLQGVEGIVVRQGGHCRMYLSVSTVGQSAMVEVDAALLEAVD